ncbi:MAG TPA: MFS transporter, partial [Thermomicrobiaceae bacterium]|nr:MFS transporter [Thermomicrobiaceae bacterium]
FAWGGFFMVIPMLSVHFVEGLGWTAGAIGLVLAARQFFQQGLTPVSGVLADRFGAKPLIAVGMLVRAAGFAAMGFAGTYSFLMGAAIFSAIGGAMFDSPRSAAVAALADERERPAYFAKTGVAAGLGITAGTQLGALLLGIDFRLVAVLAAACYLAILVMVLVWLPAVQVAEKGGALRGLGLAFHDRPFLHYTGFMGGHWFMSAQFSITLPLVATAIVGNPSAVAWVYAVNSAIAVVLGYPVPRFVERRIGAPRALIVGVLLTAVGLGMIGFSRDTFALIAAVVVYSLGVVLARPTDQIVASRLANPVALGSYFGVAALSVAFGGGLGNYAGGVLYDLGGQFGLPALPWLVFALVGAIAAAGLWWTLIGVGTFAKRSWMGLDRRRVMGFSGLGRRDR